MSGDKPRLVTERRGRPAEPPLRRKRRAQLEIDQPCLACRTGAHRACASPKCPCRADGHGRDVTLEETP